MWWFLGIFAFSVILVLALYSIYYFAFRRNKTTILDDRSLPEGEQYEPYNEGILKTIEKMLPEPYEEVWIRSHDGLKLYGRYYEFDSDAPWIIFFHGYRSSSIRDGNGIFDICKKNGYNILMVDQRAHGKSEGKTMTFGIRERYDVLSWVVYICERQGNEVPIILAGISMGAATVLMAADLKLPDNVKGIMADCPYSSPGNILRTVMKSLKLPVQCLYPFVALSARIFGRLDVESSSALKSVKNCRIPILFIHGGDDRFVPCSMSRECFEECKSRKKLVIVERAAHGISYCVDRVRYESEVKKFTEECLTNTR